MDLQWSVVAYDGFAVVSGRLRWIYSGWLQWSRGSGGRDAFAVVVL
jgi:hypothetical protein